MPAARLSIDLGTTHTVAVFRRADQQPRTLLFDGGPLLPSGVYVDPAGTVHTGRDAARLGQLEPHRFEPYPKRRVDEGMVYLGDSGVPVANLLAAILSRVASEARSAGLMPGDATVLTCPADWGQPRREVLRDAARTAGFGEVLLVDEPVAAATYVVDVLGQQIPLGASLVIFDFGGGTLDVAVVRREPAGFRVLGTGGLDDLGGLDIDAALVGHLGQLISVRDPSLWRRLSAPDGSAELRDRHTFWLEVRAAKEMLSRASTAPVSVPGRDDPLHLTRDELERVAGPLIARAVDETRRVLERTGVRPAGLLLVGGTSRLPLVGSRLHARLGIPPAVPEQPELPVAYGGLLSGGPPHGGTGPANPTSGGGYAPVSPVVGGPYLPVSPAAGAYAPISPPGGFAPVSPGGGTYLSGSAPSGPATSTGTPVPGAYGTTNTGDTPRPPGPAAAPSSPAYAVPGPPRPAVPIGPARRRGRRTPIVITSAVLAVALVVTGAAFGAKWLTDTWRGALDGGLGAGNQPTSGLTGDGGALAKRQDIELPAAGAAAVLVAGERVYYALVGAQHTDLVALPAKGGAEQWRVSVPIEPRELTLTPVGDVVILDGLDSAVDDGTVRAVVDTNGKFLWKKLWNDRRDIAYLDGDVVFEDRDEPAIERVRLKTGASVWRRPGPDDLLIIDEWRGQALTAWPAQDAKSPVVVPPAGAKMWDALSATPNVVELNEEDARGFVLDIATGRPRTSGALPLDDEIWTAYDGLIIGRRTDTGNREAVTAYRTNDFSKAWQVDLLAGTTVDFVKACGPKLVCLATSGSGDPVTTAYQTANGSKAWDLKADTADEPRWYPAGDRLLYGDGSFIDMRDPGVLDLGGKVTPMGDFLTAMACLGGRVAIRDISRTASNQQWTVSIVDLASGKRSAQASIGPSADGGVPMTFSVGGNTVAAVSTDRHVLVFQAADL